MFVFVCNTDFLKRAGLVFSQDDNPKAVLLYTQVFLPCKFHEASFHNELNMAHTKTSGSSMKCGKWNLFGNFWFDFCFTALQHILGHFGCGQLP